MTADLTSRLAVLDEMFAVMAGAVCRHHDSLPNRELLHSAACHPTALRSACGGWPRPIALVYQLATSTPSRDQLPPARTTGLSRHRRRGLGPLHHPSRREPCDLPGARFHTTSPLPIPLDPTNASALSPDSNCPAYAGSPARRRAG